MTRKSWKERKTDTHQKTSEMDRQTDKLKNVKS